MRFDIRFKGTERSGAIMEHVQRRTRFALAHLAERIRSIVFRFEDVNGPKGGVDMGLTRFRGHHDYAAYSC